MQERKKRRTTQQVKDDIMQAVGNVLAKQGVNKLGVESVASEAGMDKAMLYRHYKDFNDILKTYVEKEDFWINFLSNKEYIEVSEHNIVDFICGMFIKQFTELLENDKLQQLLIWELVDTNGLMKDIDQKREDKALVILDEIKVFFPHNSVSSNNILAIIAAGIYFLVLQKNISKFCTIDLTNKEHQKKFISDLQWLIKRIFSPITQTERIAINCINKGMELQLIADVTELSIQHIEKLKAQQTLLN